MWWPAVDVIQQLARWAGDLPDDRAKAVEMQMQLTIAALYLVEYVKHLQEGSEPYAALLSTVRGEMKLADSPSLTTFKLLMPRKRARKTAGGQ